MRNANNITLKHKRKKIWQKFVLFLCSAVVFCTTYALILPAITMEDKTICGFVEHLHDESCYSVAEDTKELICSEVSDHLHDESCYHEVDVMIDVLVCEDGSHEHNEACYKKEHKQELDCDIVHDHTNECYKNAKEKQLNCEIHEHNDACYKIIPGEKTLTCKTPEHKHIDSCFASSSVLAVIEKINNIPSADEIDAEIAKYEDNDDYDGYEAYYEKIVKEVVGAYNAYAKLSESDKAKVTNADKLFELEYIWSMHVLADPIDLTPFITDVEVKHRENADQEWQEVINGQVKAGDELLFKLRFKIDGYKLSVINNTVVYNVPIKVTNQHNGYVYNEDKQVGTYIISNDGLISITFYDDYCKDNESGTEIFGHISFESEVNELNSDNHGNVDIPIKDGVHLEISGKENTTDDLQVNKESSDIDVNNGTINYKIEVSSANGTGSKVLLTDQMKEIKLDNITSISVKDKNGNTVSVVRRSTEDGFTLELPQMAENSKYIITYTATVSNIKNFNGTKVVNNEVDVESTDKDNALLVDRDMTTDTVVRKMLSKEGAKDGDSIDWKITINESHLDISGWKLSDELQGSAYKDKVTIAPNPLTGTGSISVNLPYTFPENSKNVTYTATYTTTIDSSSGSTVNNMAFLTSPDGGEIKTDVGVGVRDNENGLIKKAAGIEVTDKTENGDILANFKWKVIFNATEQALVPYQQVVDNVSRNVWVYSDQIRNEDIHWITGAQLKELKANLTTALSGKYNSTFEVYAYRWDGTGWNPYRDPVLVTDSLPDTNKYSQFRILFYGTIEKGNTIELSYSTTVNLKDGEGAVDVKNVAILNENESYNESNQIHSPNVYKEDMMDPEGGSITYHTTEEIYKDWYHTNNGLPGIPRVLGWNIYVTFPDVEYTKDLIIIEKLPQGLKFLDDLGLETGQDDIVFSLGESDVVTGNGHFDFIEGENDTDPNSADFYYGVLDPTNTHGDPYDWVPVILERNDKNELTFKIPPRIANGLRGVTSKISLMLQIDEDYEWTALSEEFKNTVIIKYDDVEYGQASQTQVVKAPIVNKEIDTVSNNIIPYILTINKSGIDLIPGKDTLTLIDELSFEKPASGNVNANLMLDTMKVYTLDANGQRVDITDQCPFTTIEIPSEQKITKKFEMTVPDGIPIFVEYCYRISGKIGTEVEILNNASIEGFSTKVDEDETVFDIKIKESSAGAVLVGVKIVKVDSENFAFKLRGAIFRLEMWNGKEYVKVNDFITNDNGTLSTGELLTNTAYRFIEVASPYGYDIDPTPYEFIIEKADNSSVPLDFDGVSLNNGDSIIIKNRLSTYELPETGGIGTHLYYIGGISLMLLSLGAYYIVNKKENCND